MPETERLVGGVVNSRITIKECSDLAKNVYNPKLAVISTHTITMDFQFDALTRKAFHGPEVGYTSLLSTLICTTPSAKS
jgi:hypothetical protein